jgi:hypothetical protein
MRAVAAVLVALVAVVPEMVHQLDQERQVKEILG